MNLRILLSAYGVLSLIGGALWIALPGRLLNLFGATGVGSLATFLAALFGAAVIGLGLMAWLARDAGPSAARNALVGGITLINALWFGLMLIAMLGSSFSGVGWIPVAAYAIWTALFLWTGRSNPKPVAAGNTG